MTLQRSARLSALPRVDYYKKITLSKPKTLLKKRTAATTVNVNQKKSKASVVRISKTKAATKTKTEATIMAKTDQGSVPISIKCEEIRPYDYDKALSHLRSVDPKLARMITETSIHTFREKLLKADGTNPFRALSTSIIYQQIHGKAAESIRKKFINSFEPPADPLWFPSPAMVLAKSFEELRAVGLSSRKVEYIQSLAQKFQDQEIIPKELARMSDEEVSKLLCSVKGIGQWTVDMYAAKFLLDDSFSFRFLMFNLRHPDVLPVTDLAIRKGMALHFGAKSSKGKLPAPAEMQQWAEIWRPYRSLACWYMWSASNVKVVDD